MREIMFRGKCTDGGAWVLGKGIDVNSNDAYILQGWMDCDTGICGVDEIEVVPETVGQYTGLTDINGKKVFEGDIVKGSWGTVFIVFYDWNHLQFRAKLQSGIERDIDYYNGHNGIKIIGNIYDDPELLMRAVE